MVKLYRNRKKYYKNTIFVNLILSYFYMIAVQNLFNLHRLIQTKSNATNHTKIIWLKIVCL